MDDYDYVCALKQYGFWGSIKYWYFNWQGRVGMYFIINLFLKIYEFSGNLVIYHIVYLFIFLSGIFMLIKNILNRFSIQPKEREILLFSLLFFVFFHDINPVKSLLYWFNASIGYHLNIALFMCATGILFSKKSGRVSFILVFLICFLSGCCLEHFSIIFLAILILLFLWIFIFSKDNMFSDIRTKLLIAIGGYSIATIIMLMSPGMKIRMTLYPQTDIFHSLAIALNSFYHFYKFQFIPLLGKLILFSSFFSYWGITLRTDDVEKNKHNPTKYIIIILMILIGLIFLTFWILAKGVGGIGQPRTLTQIAFLLVFFFSTISFIAGYSSLLKKKIVSLLAISGIIVLTIDLSVNYIKVFPDSIRYSLSERERINILENEKLNNRTTILELDTLHYTKSVIYFSNELSANKDSGWSSSIMKSRDLKFYIVAKHQALVENITE